MTQIRTWALGLSIVVLTGVGAAASAQSLVSQSSNPADPRKAMAEEAKRSARPDAPAALPGSRAERGQAAPTQELTSAMTPTEALFDAVNRGDVPGVREALGRGADLEGRNILGLTPIELAVDLGRNDVTFLMLSLRGASQGARVAKVAPSSGKAVPMAVAKPSKAEGPVAARTAAPKPGATVRYAGDPGTPVPSAGFLGFGGLTR